MATLGIRLPQEDKEQLLHATYLNDITISHLIRTYIKQYIKEQTENGTLSKRNG